MACGAKTATKYSTCLITLGFHRAQGTMSNMQRLWRNLGRSRRTNLSIKYIYISCVYCYSIYVLVAWAAFLYAWTGLCHLLVVLVLQKCKYKTKTPTSRHVFEPWGVRLYISLVDTQNCTFFSIIFFINYCSVKF